MSKRSWLLYGALGTLLVVLEWLPALTQEPPLLAGASDERAEQVGALEQWRKTYDENASYYAYWGLPAPKAGAEAVLPEANATEALVPVEQQEGSNVLCIAGSCYRLLGIHKRGAAFAAALYNPKLKEKIAEYRTGDLLESNISVSGVMPTEVHFADAASPRRWQFRIFDVNATKYLPKERDDQ